MTVKGDMVLEEMYRAYSTGEVEWCQGTLGHMPDGTAAEYAYDWDIERLTSVCLFGAQLRARTKLFGNDMAMGDDSYRRLFISTDIKKSQSPAAFNDDPHTTYEDVMLRIKRALHNEPVDL